MRIQTMLRLGVVYGRYHIRDRQVSLIVIVNSRILQRPQKRSRGNQFIRRRLSKTKSIGSGSDPKSQTGTQPDGYGGW